jgi:aspartate aminotransferase
VLYSLPFLYRAQLILSVTKLGQLAAAQSVSGTGALRVGGVFAERFFPFPSGSKDIYVPTPTWGNHIPIFT